MAKYILLDTETTGNSEEDRVIQLGFVVLGKKQEVYNDLCLPPLPIKIGAMEVHHITPDILMNAPKITDTRAYRRLNELNINDNYLIIHNAKFDLGMLAKEGFVSKFKLIDTLKCAQHIYEDSEAHRLQYLRYAFELYKEEPKEAEKLNIEIKAHDAIGDVIIMKLLLSKLKKDIMKKFPNDNPIDKMVELTTAPILIKKFRFGKHKGRNFQEVAKEDSGYLNWMLKNMQDLDSDTRYTIKYWLR